MDLKPGETVTYVKMKRPGDFYSQWVAYDSPEFHDLIAKGHKMVPYDPGSAEERAAYWTTADDPAAVGRAFEVKRLAERLLISAYSAGLPVQGEDVRTVVRQARLFYDELEHPTEPPAPPREQEGDDEDA